MLPLLIRQCGGNVSEFCRLYGVSRGFVYAKWVPSRVPYWKQAGIVVCLEDYRKRFMPGAIKQAPIPPLTH